MNKESFTKWFKQKRGGEFHNLARISIEDLKECWNYQQKRIDALWAINLELENAINVIRKAMEQANEKTE